MRFWIPCVLFGLLLTPVASAEIVILDLGHARPPAMVGPYTVTAANISQQAAIPDGDIAYGIPGFGPYGLDVYPQTTKFTVPTTWPAWGHGYRGPVFLLDPESTDFSVYMRGSFAFYLYLRPRSGQATIELRIGGHSTGPVTLEAEDGARGFAFYATGGEFFEYFTIEVVGSSTGVGIAEFGQADRSSTCTVGTIAFGQTVEGQWTSECGSAADPYSDAQYLSFDLDEATIVEIELENSYGPELALLEGRGTTGEVLQTDYGYSGLARLAVELAAGTYTIEARVRTGSSARSFTLRLRELAGLCRSSATTLCINDDGEDRRFAVALSFASFSTGVFGTAEITDSNFDRGGVFFFFNRHNPEVMVKVLNGCAVNGHFWVFVSAVTNVGFTATVEDTVTGEFWTYENPDQNVALPVQDVRAFACESAGS